jgi:hypothetical protein
VIGRGEVARSGRGQKQTVRRARHAKCALPQRIKRPRGHTAPRAIMPAEAASFDKLDSPAARPIRALPVTEIEPDPAEALIRRLAADRLRDLRDDGVTLAYVARMYGVEAALLERLQSELVPTR